MPIDRARLDQARSAAAEIDGWLSESEGELLFTVAAGCPPHAPIVEIGSWEGKSTVWLASAVDPAKGTRVFAIDPHEKSLEDPDANTFDALVSNLARAGVADRVTPVVARSHDAAAAFDQRPGVLFIDGSHLEELVALDLEDWLPKLLDGGVLALHDVLTGRWRGPRRAVRRLLWRSRELVDVRFVDSIAWAVKVRRNRLGDRLRNRTIALLLMAYEIRPMRLPPALMVILRWVYNRTPLKGRR